MIRLVVKPDNQDISIRLPAEFLGKQVEVIAFTRDEADAPYLNADKILTHFASEIVLSKDWLTPEEDSAWQDL